MASTFVSIPPNVVCDAVRFIIDKAQRDNGMFVEVANPLMGVMRVRALLLSTSKFNPKNRLINTVMAFYTLT